MKKTLRILLSLLTICLFASVSCKKPEHAPKTAPASQKIKKTQTITLHTPFAIKIGSQHKLNATSDAGTAATYKIMNGSGTAHLIIGDMISGSQSGQITLTVVFPGNADYMPISQDFPIEITAKNIVVEKLKFVPANPAYKPKVSPKTPVELSKIGTFEFEGDHAIDSKIAYSVENDPSDGATRDNVARAYIGPWTDKIIFMRAGKIRIIATTHPRETQTTYYTAGSASITITIEKADAGGITFVNNKIGTEETTIKISDNDQIIREMALAESSVKGQNLKYEIVDAQPYGCAEIDEKSGALTPKKAGSFKVNVSLNSNDYENVTPICSKKITIEIGHLNLKLRIPPGSSDLASAKIGELSLGYWIQNNWDDDREIIFQVIGGTAQGTSITGKFNHRLQVGQDATEGQTVIIKATAKESGWIYADHVGVEFTVTLQ